MRLPASSPRLTYRPIVVLTGGPGGGKTTLIDELLHDSAWDRRVAALPEAISLMRHLNIYSRERLFQRMMMYLQLSLEDGLNRALGPDDPRLILCHRGTLDPLAYWLDRGWPEDEFFAFTETRRQDLYRRYTAVIHLVTAADGAAWAYKKWPEAHRPKSQRMPFALTGCSNWHGAVIRTIFGLITKREIGRPSPEQRERFYLACCNRIH